MKKIIAVILTVLMVIPFGLVFSSAEETNIALGKTYEYTGALIEDGKNNYPDTDNKELTDGVKPTSKTDVGYSNSAVPLWVGLNIGGTDADKTNNQNYIIVDLGETKTNLTKFVLYSESTEAGITKPKSVEVFVSDDKANFTTSVGKDEAPVKVVDAEIAGKPEEGVYTYTVTGNASGRYVKFLIKHQTNWCFVSEVEVYQDPDAEPAPTPEQETITIDGKFDDNGWKEDGWTHATKDNTRLYGAEAAIAERNDTFDFQFRTDDTKLYVALKSDNKPFGTDEIFGNGAGTQFRLWFFTDGFKDDANNEYTTYNYLIDFVYKNGNLSIVSKKNTAYSGNKGEDVTLEGFDAKATSTDNSFYVEAVIPFAAIRATTGTNVYVTYSGPNTVESLDKAKASNVSLTYPKIGEYDDNGKLVVSWAYIKWDKDNDLELVFADLKLGTINNSGDIDDDYDLVTSEPLEEPAYELALSTKPEKYWPNTEITVCVTIKNIVPDAGIGLIQFKLYYDKTKVEPIVKNDGDSNAAMDDFLKKSPDLETWKKGAICQIFEEDGYYDISYLTDKNTGLAKEDGSIEIEIPFKVKADVNSSIVFQIPHGEDGTMGADVNTDPVYGNGGKVLVKRSTTDPTASTSSSTSSASQATSSTTTSTLPTGDAGTYAIAIVAMVALAGAATVAVKKRNR